MTGSLRVFDFANEGIDCGSGHFLSVAVVVCRVLPPAAAVKDRCLAELEQDQVRAAAGWCKAGITSYKKASEANRGRSYC
jgi:hypothetical protein